MIREMHRNGMSISEMMVSHWKTEYLSKIKGLRSIED